MLRKILIALAMGISGAVGYIIGVRAGFDAGVRDYLENGGQLLEQVAAEKEKFDFHDMDDIEGLKEAMEEASSERGFQ